MRSPASTRVSTPPTGRASTTIVRKKTKMVVQPVTDMASEPFRTDENRGDVGQKSNRHHGSQNEIEVHCLQILAHAATKPMHTANPARPRVK
ncbi:hypothetical protein GCM10023158_12940 [Gluconacetobacter tumulicola]